MARSGHHEERKDYAHVGAFDVGKFQKAYADEFKNVEKFNLASMSDLLFLVGKIGADPRITDIRWSAYLLATAFIESSRTVRITKKTIDKKGRVKLHRVKVWRNFAPIDEVGRGKGRIYGRPVKVKRLPNGDARLTEIDGDQWTISTDGSIHPMKSGERRGFRIPGMISSPEYESDDGTEQFYFGRGYVQLTWWTGYLEAGIALGRGLSFLFHPERIEDREIAYATMTLGMCTGKIFANGRRLSQYFHGAHTDYEGARNMVNPGAARKNKVEVAGVARRFEKVLLASKSQAKVASR